MAIRAPRRFEDPNIAIVAASVANRMWAEIELRCAAMTPFYHAREIVLANAAGPVSKKYGPEVFKRAARAVEHTDPATMPRWTTRLLYDDLHRRRRAQRGKNWWWRFRNVLALGRYPPPPTIEEVEAQYQEERAARLRAVDEFIRSNPY